jgi:hypothetical protein
MAAKVTWKNARIAPTEQQLADFVVGTTKLATGPCPRCRALVSHQLTLDGTVIAGLDATGRHPVNAPQAMLCNCDESHPDRAEGVRNGCGAWWVCRAVSPDGESYTLAVESDPVVEAAMVTVAGAVADTKTTFAATAEKWIPGVSALTGVAGLAAIVLSRDALLELGTIPRIFAFGAIVAAVVCTAVATFLAYLAAFGLGRRLDLSSSTAVVAAAALVNTRTGRSARHLRTALGFAAGAVALLLGGLGVLLFGPAAAAPATTQPTVRVAYDEGGDSTRPAEVCGTLIGSAEGELRVRVTDGPVQSTEVIELADATSVRAVADCAGS